VAFVLDCSATMPWILRNDETGYVDQVLRTLDENPAVVPELWHLEVSNVLLVFERRGRIDVAESNRFTSLLQELPISTDEGTHYRVFSRIINLRDTFYHKTLMLLEFTFRPGINERYTIILPDKFFWFYWLLRPFGMVWRFLSSHIKLGVTLQKGSE